MSDPIRELEIAEDRLASLETQLATMAELNASQREILSTVAAQRDAAVARAEAANAHAMELRLALGAAVERANRLAIWADRYGADQWRRGNAGQEPQEFDEWQKEAQP